MGYRWRRAHLRSDRCGFRRLAAQRLTILQEKKLALAKQSVKAKPFNSRIYRNYADSILYTRLLSKISKGDCGSAYKGKNRDG